MRGLEAGLPRDRLAGWLPYLALVVVQLSYCIWHVLGKLALNGGMDPFVLAMYRQVGATVLIVCLAKAADAPHGDLFAGVRAACTRRDACLFLLLGVLGFGNIYGFIVALSYVTAFNSALLHPTIPVFAALLAGASGVERIGPRTVCGICLSACGAVVVVVYGVPADHNTEGGGEVSNADAFVGNAILLAQCFCMGGLLVLQKHLITRTGLGAATTTGCYNAVAVVLAVLATTALVGGDAQHYAFHSAVEIWALLYGVVLGGCLVYVLLAWATQQTSPTVVSLSMTLQPPLNAVLSVLFLGRDSFSAGEIIGGALITAGLVVTVLRSRQKADGADSA
eukprot:CAMPEP_0184212382 /NCGR_PEP_ID=MMETSP0976-20121227/13609_1 /TAXON_ID=483370 /ORGANISM="non described non described, Strain CCMP2097" /LENGTH=336 /DNA_ID=CAMNT_0026517101 /DNA_START=39 /DNA_END=1045 /DNA_ORIENTATION=+